MTSTYRAVMLTSNDVLETVELPIQAPGPGQIRVRVRAAGVGSTELMMLAPMIAQTFSLLDARAALDALAAGGVAGKIVLEAQT